jgi:two-component system response regulator FlrC
VDIRIIATSNRHMASEVAKGTFREDLFYRLNVFPLQTLPLAARPKDIPVLARAMLRRHSAKMPTPLLSEAACAALLAHGWPGNVRELENVMQRALVLAEGAEIGPEHIMLLSDAAPIDTAQAA